MHSEDCSAVKKFVQLIPVGLVILMIIMIGIAFTHEILFQNSNIILKILFTPIFYISLIMTIINYSLSVMTDPGRVIQEKCDPEAVREELYCKKCEKNRPDRAHHCRVCNRCFLKMDHHCIWIANCVGFNNQKFFYLFVFYAMIGTLASVICFFPEFIDYLSSGNSIIDYQNQSFLSIIERPSFFIIGFFLSFALFMVCLFMFLVFTYLIMNNLTSIENNSLKRESKRYQSDCYMKNLSMVLGTESKWEWLLPIFKPNLNNEGHSFIPIRNYEDYILVNN